MGSEQKFLGVCFLGPMGQEWFFGLFVTATPAGGGFSVDSEAPGEEADARRATAEQVMEVARSKEDAARLGFSRWL